MTAAWARAVVLAVSTAAAAGAELPGAPDEELARIHDLTALADAACERGDVSEEERLYRAALDLARRAAAGGVEVGRSLQALAHVASHRDEWDREEALLEEALAAYEPVNGTASRQGYVLTRLGRLAMFRGDQELAQRWLLRALPLYGNAPDSLERAAVLTEMAHVALQRLDLPLAERLYREALAVHERVAPRTLDVAALHDGLASAARLRDDFSTASAEYDRALALMDELGASGHMRAMTLADMTMVALDQGLVDEAEKRITRATELLAKDGRETVVDAQVAEMRGRVAWLRDRPEAAVKDLEAAVAIRARQGAGNLSEAESVFALGWTYRQLGRREPAAQQLCHLIDLLEDNKARVGGGEDARSDYASKLVNYYADCLELLVEMGRHAEAFQMLERARGRRFLTLLAERGVSLDAQAPPELQKELRRLRREYDVTQARLWNLPSDASPGAAAALRARLKDQRRAMDDVVSGIRERSPRLAALQYPQPMDLAKVQAALDPGTVALSYSVGPRQTLLFVVTPTGLSVHPLPVEEAALRTRVQAFRRLIEDGDASARIPPALVESARELHRTLVEPAAAEIAGARRLLICPDGPLHALPFAALVREAPAKGRPRFLAESLPLHVAASVSVYAQLKSRRVAGLSAGRVVAFADPAAYGPAGAASYQDPALRGAAERGLSFSPLPAARREAAELRRLYPGAVAWLGAEATEERARALGGRLRYLHFACHALLDDALPLNSGLVLTLRDPPAEGQQNGLLQAWEILESVRVEAELVTLSACASGLGREVVGEGLLGLTRAFHHAGARSVLASLWSVPDMSTARLMARFYGGLRGGLAKDQALAAAQRALLRQPRWRHPYHWAAFQLSGDWR